LGLCAGCKSKSAEILKLKIMEIFTTNSSTPPRERIDDWLDVLSRLFVKLEYVSVGESDDAKLFGHVEHRQLSNLTLNTVTSSRQRVERRPRRMGQSDSDYFLFAMQLNGIGEVRQDGRRAVLRPGDYAHYDTTRPYELEFQGDFRQLVITVPRAQLRMHVPAAEKITARTVSSRYGAGLVLRGVLESLPTALDHGVLEGQSALSSAVLDLVAATLLGVPVPDDVPASKLKRYHLERIKSYVMQHISDPELSVTAIAEALDMAVSSLYRAFESEPRSLAQLIWDQRLAGAKAMLIEPSWSQKSIKEIALEWGFSDPAHFSRVFRQRFDASPRELRNKGKGVGLSQEHASWQHS
jgi:AraC-like DNA-binding protein